MLLKEVKSTGLLIGLSLQVERQWEFTSFIFSDD